MRRRLTSLRRVSRLGPTHCGGFRAQASKLLFIGLFVHIFDAWSSSPRPRSSRRSQVSTPLVLLVDSHEDSRAIYSVIFRHGGFAVVAAARADEALRQARLTPPDLVVMEVAPPRDGALNALRGFRGEPATARVPLVVLSTVPTDRERDLLLAEGVSCYLAKPCPPLALLTEARRILGR